MSRTRKKNEMDAATVVIAALVASAIGALFYNLLPLYLGTAQDYLGLDNRDIGFLSSGFFLGFNTVTISAFFWIRRVAWSAVVAVATPVAALSLVAGTTFDRYSVLLVSVILAGGALAALYGVGTTILGDTSKPARWYGVKIAAEALPGAILLLVLPSTAIARWGFNGTVIGMLIAIIFMSPFLFWIPRRGVKDPHTPIAGLQAHSMVLPQSPYIWGTLIATLTFFSGASATWAFIERIGARAGFDAPTVGVLLSVTLVFAVIGSLFAAALAGRYGNVRPYAAGAAAFVASLLLLDNPGSLFEYALAACAITFAFGFMLPIAVTEIAELDHDGRYVVLSVPAIGIGALAGPAIAGMLSMGGNFRSMLAFTAATIVLSVVLIVFSAARARRSVTRRL